VNVSSIDWLSAVILVLIAIDFIMGFRKGLVRQVIDLVGIIVAILAALRLYPSVGQFVGRLIGGMSQAAANVVGFIIVFVGMAILVELVGYAVSLVMRLPGLSFLNSMGGAVFGVARAVLVISVVLVVLSSLHIPSVTATIERSPVAVRIREVAPFFYKQFDRMIPEAPPAPGPGGPKSGDLKYRDSRHL
jgi:membrane protein required for colicin V production